MEAEKGTLECLPWKPHWSLPLSSGAGPEAEKSELSLPSPPTSWSCRKNSFFQQWPGPPAQAQTGPRYLDGCWAGVGFKKPSGAAGVSCCQRTVTAEIGLYIRCQYLGVRIAKQKRKKTQGPDSHPRIGARTLPVAKCSQGCAHLAGVRRCGPGWVVMV